MSRESQPIGTCVIVKNGDKVLLGKRKNSYKAGEYGLPGGRIEGNELAEAAAKRELTEETGLLAELLLYLGVVKEWQEERHFIHFVFICEKWEGKPQLLEPEKCEEWEWLLLDELPKNVLAGHRAAISLLNSEKTGFTEL